MSGKSATSPCRSADSIGSRHLRSRVAVPLAVLLAACFKNETSGCPFCDMLRSSRRQSARWSCGLWQPAKKIFPRCDAVSSVARSPYWFTFWNRIWSRLRAHGTQFAIEGVKWPSWPKIFVLGILKSQPLRLRYGNCLAGVTRLRLQL